MEDETTKPVEGVTPSPAPPQGAKPDPDAKSGPDGAVKALRTERERRKALEKTASEFEAKLKGLEGELDGYRRRDAAEAAITAPLEALRKAGANVDIQVEELKKFLVRLPVEDMPEAAEELVRSMVGQRWKARRPPISGQPKMETHALPDGPLSTAQLLRLQEVGGPEAVEAALAARRNSKRQ